MVFPQCLTPANIFNRGKHTLTGGPGAAGQCLAVLSAMFSFAKRRGLCADNPALGVTKPRGQKMERYLTSHEISILYSALSDEAEKSGNPYPAAAIKLLLLTG